jgi:4-amino-4-deoxy-L-arabinose transferase-like glycosyltransferase
MSGQSSKSQLYGGAVFALGLVAGLAMVFGAFDAQGFVRDKFDPYFFGEMGKSLARGEGFAPYGSLLMRRSPLYPLMIGGIYIAFGESPRLVQLLQCLMLGGTCWLVFDMGRRLGNLRTGILAGVACALHPLMLRYVADLHLETMLTFLATLMVWCAVRFYAAPTVLNGVAFGVAAALATLTKAVFLLYPATFLGVLVLLRVIGRRTQLPSLGAIAAVVLAMGLVIAPWTIRNYYATNGKFVLVSSGFNDAFLRGLIFSQTDYALLRRPPYTDAENETNAWFRALSREAGTEWQRDDYETEQLLGKTVKKVVRENPGAVVRKTVVGLFTFWYQMTSWTNSFLTGILALGVWLCAALGWRRAMLEDRPFWLVILPAVYLNLLLAVLLALGRYSAPIVPSLLVSAAFGVDTVLARWNARSGRQASI